ncbi:MAG: beta-lactamase regulating signal transducer with metallopeptidase domain [Mariniblastus sp.]|jgi:beta-lactamase regulating signal transducer with metallopeptidase domain
MIDFFTGFNRCLFLTLVHSIWQFTALALISWSVGRLLRRSVEWNYTINVAALMIGMVAVPVTFFLIGNAEFSKSNLELNSSHVVVSEFSSGSSTIPLQNSDTGLNLLLETVWQVPTPAQTKILYLFELLSPWVVGLYLVGVAMMFTRLSFSIHRTGLINSQARPLSIAGLDDLVLSLANAWSMKVVPRIALAEQIVVPKVIGLWRSTILLPTSAITGLSQEDLEMILAHELAHVQRYDLWVNLIQRIAESVMFFNPAMWIVSRRIESLREYCCDEKACQSIEAKIGDATNQPRTRYALALLRVVELAQESINHVSVSDSELTALAASGRSPSELRRRVARLFGEPLREPIRLSRGSLAIGVMALLILFGPTVWKSQAESISHEKIRSAMSASLDFESVASRNSWDRSDVMSDDAADEPNHMMMETGIGFPNDLVDLNVSVEPIAQQSSLSGQILDESGNPLPDVKVVLDGGLNTRLRGQEAITDDNGMYRFVTLDAGVMTTSDGPPYRTIGLKFSHAEYVAADGATRRDIKIPTAPTHQEILNLIMVSRGTDNSTANVSHFTSVAPSPDRASIIQLGASEEAGFSRHLSHNGIDFVRQFSGEGKVKQGVSDEELFLIGKLKHRIQNVFDRPSVRKRSPGIMNQKQFQWRPLLLTKRS